MLTRVDKEVIMTPSRDIIWETNSRIEQHTLLDPTLDNMTESIVFSALSRASHFTGRVGQKVGCGRFSKVYRFGDLAVKLTRGSFSGCSPIEDLKAELTLAEIVNGKGLQAGGFSLNAVRPVAAMFGLRGSLRRAAIVMPYIPGSTLYNASLEEPFCVLDLARSRLYGAVAGQGMPCYALNLDPHDENFIVKGNQITKVDTGATSIFNRIMQEV
jgi:hypothetical protein